MEDAFVKHTNWDVRRKTYILFRKLEKNQR
jgi:hypothetical protein